MAIREIVVHVDGADDTDSRIEQALGVASRHEAHLVGLYVVDIPVIAGAMLMDVPGELYSLQRKASLERAAHLRARFEKSVTHGPVSTEWRQDEGLSDEQICMNARRSDLVIVGLSPGPTATTERSRAAATRVMLSAGVPVLVMPASGAGAVPGQVVTVGWDGSREAARAVHDALPILQRAERVAIACIDPDAGAGAPHGDLPGAGIAHWLARHGVNAEAQTVASGGNSTGEALLEWTTGQGSDLLVTGGYGHSRVRELILGGVTRHVLTHAHVPVLMSH